MNASKTVPLPHRGGGGVSHWKASKHTSTSENKSVNVLDFLPHPTRRAMFYRRQHLYSNNWPRENPCSIPKN